MLVVINRASVSPGRGIEEHPENEKTGTSRLQDVKGEMMRLSGQERSLSPIATRAEEKPRS